jgi:large subunit ribosomal protein L24
MKKIKKNDIVTVITGKDKGKTGKVLSVINSDENIIIKVIVEGINLAKKHVKANPNKNETGRIVEKPMPIHISNVKLYDESTGQGSRVGIRILEDGKRVRYFKKTDQLIDVNA